MSNVFKFTRPPKAITVKRDEHCEMLGAFVTSSLVKSTRDQCSAQEYISNIINLVVPDDVKTDTQVELGSKLGADNSLGHVMSLLNRSAGLLLELGNALKLGYLTDGPRVVISDGVEFQADRAYPNPMLIVLAGSCGDSMERSVVVSAKAVTFDGQFKDYDKPSISGHPKTPVDEGFRNLDVAPTVQWNSDYGSMVRGTVHPGLVSAALKVLTNVALACNGGLTCQWFPEDREYRFSCLIITATNSCIEWAITLDMSVYSMVWHLKE